jgi:putative inorganic carbon (hco3(-)) transporter
MSALFCLYLALLIVRPQEFVPALVGLPILQVLLLLCLALWAVSKDKRLSLPPFVLMGWLLLFIPLTVGLNGWWGGIPAALGQIVPPIGIFVAASMAARELRALHAYMWTILVCAGLLVYHSMIQLQTGVGPLTAMESYMGRPYYLGIFSDPNDLGQLFAIALTFALYLLTISRQLLAKLFLQGSIVWLFYGMILTNSRGALLAALTVLALEGWRRYGRIAVGIAAALALPTLFAVTRLSQLSSGEQSANDRIHSWYEGIQMLLSHPFYGVGFGNYTNYNTITAHNFIVLPMAELGFVGLTLWLGVIWYSIRMLWWVGFGPHATTNNDNKTPADQAAGREILAARGLLMVFVSFIVSAFFLSQSYKAPLFLLCGLAVARFVAATRVLPDAPHYRLLSDLPRLGALGLACIIGIYVLMRLTL